MNELLSKGTVVGGFEIGRKIGRGGFGITYLAREVKDKQKYYAVKEYFPSDYAQRLSSGAVRAKPSQKALFKLGLDSFITEAKILEKLPRKTGLVRVRAAFRKQGTAYCVMEYIKGDSLDKMIDRIVNQHDAVAEDLIVDFLSAVAPALSAIHEQKLIHRDVKPGNVMINKESNQPILIDFGAARHVTRNSDSTIMFTRRYAAIEQFPLELSKLPKQLREGPWTDIYALSVILYEMVSQRTPPDAQFRVKTLQANNPDPYEPIAQLLARTGVTEPYSERLLKLIDFGCELFPENRPADAMVFLDLLLGNPIANAQLLSRHPQFGTSDRIGVPRLSPLPDWQATGTQSSINLAPTPVAPAKIASSLPNNRASRSTKQPRSFASKLLLAFLLFGIAVTIYLYFNTNPREVF